MRSQSALRMGRFHLPGIPAGDWRVTIFDQWNDQIVDGISTPVRVSGATVDMGEIAVHQWKNNLYTRTFLDTNGDGVSQDNEPGLALVPTNIRFRDGSISNLNSTDLDGFAGFNEVFPMFNWYVIETDSTRYKNTGIHVVYDAGGPVDGSAGQYACGQGGFPPCGNSSLLANMARTNRGFPSAPRTCGFRARGIAPMRTDRSRPGDTAGRFHRPNRSALGYQLRLAELCRTEPVPGIRQEALRGR